MRLVSSVGRLLCAPLLQNHPKSHSPDGQLSPYPSQYLPGVQGKQKDDSDALVKLLNVPGGHLNGVAVPAGQ